MTIRIFERGVVRDMQRAVGVFPPKDTRRGMVRGFSDESRLRLRMWLLTRYIPSTTMYGVCLTIPKQDDMSGVVSSFRQSVHRLRTYFLRQFPSSGFIWRVELQRNMMPHLHLVLYTSTDDVRGRFFLLWRDCVRGLFRVPSEFDFSRRGVDVRELDGDIRAYRYICDHGSKRKQAQLGWQGRQWGVVGRKFFAERDSKSYTLDDRKSVRLSRFLRRIASFSVPADCVFGSRLVRRRGKVAVMYARSVSVMRWLELYSTNFEDSQDCFHVETRISQD